MKIIIVHIRVDGEYHKTARYRFRIGGTGLDIERLEAYGGHMFVGWKRIREGATPVWRSVAQFRRYLREAMGVYGRKVRNVEIYEEVVS